MVAKKLEEITQELAALKARKTQKAVACGMESEVKSDYSREIEYLHGRIENLWNMIYEVRGMIYEHAHDGHLPEIEGAAAMEKALKALGLDGDYKVEKKTIYASTGKIEGREFILKSSHA